MTPDQIDILNRCAERVNELSKYSRQDVIFLMALLMGVIGLAVYVIYLHWYIKRLEKPLAVALAELKKELNRLLEEK